MKIQRKKISGKAVLLDCFSTPCECTEFLTIYLSNSQIKQLLKIAKTLLTQTATHSRVALSNGSRGCSPSCQDCLAGIGSMSRAQDWGPSCAPAALEGTEQPGSWPGSATAAA